jgi:3-hydroxybutyryl-CoA dehydratase
MTEIPHPPGRYFEEFEIGESIETPARTITEADVVTFAGLSGDYNPLHTDAEFAKETMFGERVAHGLLGLSIVSGLAWRTGFMEGTADALTSVETKFRNPVRFGDTIHARFEVKRKKAMRRMGGGFVIFDVLVLNQRNETVQKGEWMVLIRSAP